jgi:hypothetical protein
MRCGGHVAREHLVMVLRRIGCGSVLATTPATATATAAPTTAACAAVALGRDFTSDFGSAVDDGIDVQRGDWGQRNGSVERRIERDFGSDYRLYCWLGDHFLTRWPWLPWLLACRAVLVLWLWLLLLPRLVLLLLLWLLVARLVLRRSLLLLLLGRLLALCLAAARLITAHVVAALLLPATAPITTVPSLCIAISAIGATTLVARTRSRCD